MFVRNPPARTTSSNLGRLQNRREVLEDALSLGHNTPLDHLASGRVLGDLPAEVEETTDFDCLGKRADRATGVQPKLAEATPRSRLRGRQNSRQ